METGELDRIRAYYEGDADQYAGGPPQGLYAQQAIATLKQVTGPGMRVLDVGCGPGFLTRELDPGVEVVGFDLSPRMVDHARAGRPGGRYFVHSFTDPIPDEWGQFDIVVALGCLEYCAELPAVIGHLARVVRPGAILLASVPERRTGILRHESHRQQIWSGQDLYIYFHSLRDQLTAIEAAGLHPITYAFMPAWRNQSWGGVWVYHSLWRLRRP